MVDKDGSFTYSSVILIKETTKNAGFTLHQNPVSNEMVLNIVSSSLLNTEALLLNNIGIVVKRFAIKELKQKINVSSDSVIIEGNKVIVTLHKYKYSN